MKYSVVRSAAVPGLEWVRERLNELVRDARARWHYPEIEVSIPSLLDDGSMSPLFVVVQAEPVVLELVEYSVRGAHYDWHTDDHAISLSVQLSNSDAYQGSPCPIQS